MTKSITKPLHQVIAGLTDASNQVGHGISTGGGVHAGLWLTAHPNKQHPWKKHLPLSKKFPP